MATNTNSLGTNEKAGTANKELIMGVWTKEEFYDDLVLGIFGALVGFFTALIYMYLTRWLHEHKWFVGGEEK
jgi:hypothetical protein